MFGPVISLAAPLIRWLMTFLPPDIHPMVVHFPIVLLYLTGGIDIAAMLVDDRERLWQRMGFWTLTLACFFTVITMMLGVVSEQFVHFSPVMAAILQRHQDFAALTGLCEGTAWLVRVLTRFPRGRGWSVLAFGHGKATWVSTVLVIAAVVFVTMTARLGGKMVYDYGAGVLGVTRTIR